MSYPKGNYMLWSEGWDGLFLIWSKMKNKCKRHNLGLENVEIVVELEIFLMKWKWNKDNLGWWVNRLYECAEKIGWNLTTFTLWGLLGNNR